MIQRLNYLSEDPTILSGTLRSTLDVFDEYQDADIVSVSLLPAPSEVHLFIVSTKHCVVFT